MELLKYEKFHEEKNGIPALQWLALAFLFVPFGIDLILYIFISFDNKHNAPIQTRLSNLSVVALVDLHSSGFTFGRINQIQTLLPNNSLYYEKKFEKRVIVSKYAQVKDSLTLKYVNCSDSINSLSCRVDSSFESFLKDYPRIGWLYRATDDSYIDTKKLYNYINFLNEIYNPFTDIVIRAHANFEGRTNYYIHGGPGWLLSRAFVQFHFDNNISLSKLEIHAKYQQDDTAESIVVRSIFDSHRKWDEFYIVGFFCKNCNITERKQIKTCPITRKVGLVKDIISIHMFGLKTNQVNLVERIKENSNDLFFYRNDNEQSIYLCKSRYARHVALNLKRHTHVKRSKTLSLDLFYDDKLS